jgi:hypothetical protein
MRLDCTVALRLALDDMQGRIIRGEKMCANPARSNAALQNSRAQQTAG